MKDLKGLIFICKDKKIGKIGKSRGLNMVACNHAKKNFKIMFNLGRKNFHGKYFKSDTLLMLYEAPTHIRRTATLPFFQTAM